MRLGRSRTIAHLGGALTALFALGLAGCVGTTNDAAPPKTLTPTQPGTTAAGKSVRAALVLDTGGVDDKSFNASAWAGAQKAQKELGMSESDIKYIETKADADFKTNLTTFATQNYDVVIAIGYKMKDALKEVAPQFPNIKFAIVDESAPEGTTNCKGIRFKEEQGTFLAGYLAASMSKTKKIGFVGGQEGDLIGKFEAGYRAGAKTAGFDPDKQVLTSYTGDWNDLTKGRSNAEQEFGNGADIIFQAAGKAGLGVIEAAKAKGPGFYAIGVDQDQDYIAEGRVLTSMVKHVDTSVFDTIKQVKEGNFQAGDHVYDLKEGGVGLSDMKYTKKDIPADVLAKLEKLKQMVADGTVVPPSKVKDVAAFQPPKL